MSIINDALKKTQKNFTKNTSDGFSKPQNKNIFNQNHKDDFFKKPLKEIKTGMKFYGIYILVTVFILFLLTCFIGFVYFKNFSLVKKIFSDSSINTPAQIRDIDPPPQISYAASKEAEEKENKLILNGTMMVENKWVAVINNEIYQTGDYVNGMKIINITLKEVKLSHGNESISLKTD